MTAVVAGLIAAAIGGSVSASAAKRPRDTPSLLVVGLGDSLASGEGNPDVPRRGNTAAEWEDLRCDRSQNSFEAKVVAKLKLRRQLQFAYLACSGASLVNGLLGPYAGINPPEHAPDLPGQVEEARRIAAGRKAAAVMISAGVNDLEFGSVATYCATFADYYCPDLPYHGTTLADWMKKQLELLPARYDRLATALAPLVSADHVFITEYPDLVSTSPEALCKLITFVSPLEIRERSIAWLYHNFYLPLNATIRAAAKAHGWHAIDAPRAFERHGYCTKSSWIVSFTESNDRQGNAYGTLHPNQRGQAEIVDGFYPVVFKALSGG